jgi:hypothetical protein
VADGSAHLVVKARPSAAGPCATSSASDTGAAVLDQTVDDGPAGGWGPLTASVTAPDPGPFLICAWLEDPGPVVLASQFQEVTIRPGAQILELDYPPWQPFRSARPGLLRVERGVPVDLTAVVNNDLPNRLAYMSLTKGACAASFGAQAGTVLLNGAQLRSGAGRPLLTRVALPRLHFDRGGRQRICGWVQEGAADTDPEDTVFQSLTVAKRKTRTLAQIVRAGRRSFLLATSGKGVPLDRGKVTFRHGDRALGRARGLSGLKPAPYCAGKRQLGLFTGVPAGATAVGYSGAKSLRPSTGSVTTLKGLRKGRCRR